MRSDRLRDQSAAGWWSPPCDESRGARGSPTLEYELYPIAATITGNVAVLHYACPQATENGKKEHRYSNGRWTNVLIKETGGFLPRWPAVA